MSPLPYGDGGLFYTMAGELRGGSWPMTTSYNQAGIPFAYPPLGLMLLAVIPGDILDLMRWLPPLLSAASVAVVFVLCREIVSDRTAAVGAAAYAVMPAGWGLNGADAVRSLGVLLALLAVWVGWRAQTSRETIGAGVMAGLATLSHPSAAAFVVITAALYAIRRPQRWSHLVAAGGAALAIVLPWLAFVLLRYGPDPLLSAATSHVTSFPLARLATFGPTGLGPLDPLVGVAVIGALWRPWLGAWALVLVFLPATSDRYLPIAVALLIAVALFELQRRISGGVLMVATALAFVALVGQSPSITPDIVQRMREEVAASPTAPAFAVRSDDGSVVEWFPALTRARSVGTSQGLEWVSHDAFWDAVRVDRGVQAGLDVGVPIVDLRARLPAD